MDGAIARSFSSPSSSNSIFVIPKNFCLLHLPNLKGKKIDHQRRPCLQDQIFFGQFFLNQAIVHRGCRSEQLRTVQLPALLLPRFSILAFSFTGLADLQPQTASLALRFLAQHPIQYKEQMQCSSSKACRYGAGGGSSGAPVAEGAPAAAVAREGGGVEAVVQWRAGGRSTMAKI